MSKREKKMGLHASDTAQVVLQDCRVSDADRIGEVGAAFGDVRTVLDRGRIGIGALAVGLGRAALETAVAYAKERKQFGKAIAEFQAIQFMLADMKVEVESSRLLLYEAARKCDESAPDLTLWAALCKLKAGDTAMRVTTDAVQILGGFGYSTEYPVERMMRDAKITQIYEGTNQIQRVVIARSLLR